MKMGPQGYHVFQNNNVPAPGADGLKLMLLALSPEACAPDSIPMTGS